MKDQILALFKDEYGDASEANVDIIQHRDGSLTIEVDSMYSRPIMRGTLLETLQGIAQITGLPEVDEGDSICCGGCETCDYGSHYGYTFHAFSIT